MSRFVAAGAFCQAVKQAANAFNANNQSKWEQDGAYFPWDYDLSSHRPQLATLPSGAGIASFNCLHPARRDAEIKAIGKTAEKGGNIRTCMREAFGYLSKFTSKRVDVVRRLDNAFFANPENDGERVRLITAVVHRWLEEGRVVCLQDTWGELTDSILRSTKALDVDSCTKHGYEYGAEFIVWKKKDYREYHGQGMHVPGCCVDMDSLTELFFEHTSGYLFSVINLNVPLVAHENLHWMFVDYPREKNHHRCPYERGRACEDTVPLYVCGTFNCTARLPEQKYVAANLETYYSGSGLLFNVQEDVLSHFSLSGDRQLLDKIDTVDYIMYSCHPEQTEAPSKL